MRRLFITFLISLILIPNTVAKTIDKTNDKLRPAGYKGILPDITNAIEPYREELGKPSFENAKNFTDEKFIKPVPRENPTFVNVIIKKNKISQYVNDINEIIPMIEAIADSIERKDEVQIFNTKVNFLDVHVKHLQEKYQGRTESEYTSFLKLSELNRYANSVAILRNEAIYYAPYLAYHTDGYIYSPNNINQQLQYLLAEIEDTLFILKDVQ